VIYLYVEFVTNPAGLVVLRYLTTTTIIEEPFHRWGKDSRAGVITGLLLILSPIFYLALRANHPRRAGWALLAAALAYPLMGVLKLSKSDFLVPALNILIVDYYYRKYALARAATKHLWVKLGVVILVSLILFYLSTALRIGIFIESSAESYASAIGFTLDAPTHVRESLAMVYGYTVLPFENFHRFLNSYSGGYHPGISFFRPLLSALGQGDTADAMISEIHYVAVSPAANTSTFLAALYAELGLYGLVLVPLIYGTFVNLLYVRFRRQPDFPRFFVYLCFVYPWVWIFFFNGFSVLTFYINAAFVMLLAAAASILARRERLAAAGPGARAAGERSGDIP
jgi:oligosaccharide repeat unit polymerase